MKSSKNLKENDIITLKKPHPCGSNKWMLLEVGMQLKLKCLGCGRKLTLTRREFEKRYKENFRENVKI